MTRFASCLLSNNSVVHLYTMQISCMMPFYRKFQQMWHQRVMAARSCAKRKPKQIRKPKHSLILVCSETSVTTNQYLDRNVLPSSFVTGIFVSSRIDENFALNSFFSFLSHEKDIRDRIDDAAVACCVYFYCGLPLPMPANLNGFKYMLVPLFIFEILIS